MVAVAPHFPVESCCVCEEQPSYGAVLTEHYEAVRCFLESLCRRADLSRDLAQETYLRAYAHLARHARRVERPREWLFTIARCTFIDHVRYAAVRPARCMESADRVEDVRALTAVEAAATEEERERLSHAIEQLSPVNRALVVGFHLAGEDFGVLAERHGLSRTAARVRVFRARRELRRRLG